MAGTYPEVWSSRFRENLAKGGEEDFLDGIDEIDAEVSVINRGTKSEKNIIHVPTSDFEVDVLLNNTTYPIPVQEWTDSDITLNLDKITPKVISITDDQKIGSCYDMIDKAQRNSLNGINKSKYQKAIHSLAPMANTASTPIFKATGGSDSITDSTGRLILTYEDLVSFKRLCGSFDKIRVVLNDQHWNDLLLDRKNFGNQLVNYQKGTPMPFIAGMEITNYRGEMPIITVSGLTKKAYGSVASSGDAVASVAFDPTAVGKKTGETFQYFSDAKNNPRTQSNELGYRHYFIAVPYRNEKIGAII